VKNPKMDQGICNNSKWTIRYIKKNLATPVFLYRQAGISRKKDWQFFKYVVRIKEIKVWMDLQQKNGFIQKKNQIVHLR